VESAVESAAAQLMPSDILKQIAITEAQMALVRQRISDLKKELSGAESELITIKLQHEGLREQVRVHKNTTPHRAMDAREQEIKDFQDKYPELCGEKDDETI
jgi:regulator of replication initiation timing